MDIGLIVFALLVCSYIVLIFYILDLKKRSKTNAPNSHRPYSRTGSVPDSYYTNPLQSTDTIVDYSPPKRSDHDSVRKTHDHYDQINVEKFDGACINSVHHDSSSYSGGGYDGGSCSSSSSSSSD